MPLQPRIGGSFAPPLSDAKLAEYAAMVDSLPPSPVKDHMATLLHCCNQWWELPESNGTRVRAHPVGVGTIVDLHPEIMSKLEPHIPWMEELDMMAGVFEAISAETHKPLRDAAFHLLWHAKELCLDREPLTADKLVG